MSDTSLARLRRYAYWLDSGIRIPGLGWRIGFDSILGLVPGLGDSAGAVLGGWVFVEALRMGVPAPTLARMLLNLALDSTVGAVPILGDLFDFVWKANVRNIELLERHLHDPVRARTLDRVFLAAVAVAAGVLCLVPVVLGVWLLARLFF